MRIVGALLVIFVFFLLGNTAEAASGRTSYRTSYYPPSFSTPEAACTHWAEYATANGHSGATYTYERLTVSYYWPNGDAQHGNCQFRCGSPSSPGYACYNPFGSTQCPVGQVWREDIQVCGCPEGLFWDPAQQKCLEPCPIKPLPDVTDPEAKLFEANPDRSDITRLTQRMKDGLQCLQDKVRGAGGTSSVGSTYRPPIYNQHLIDVWDKWKNELERERRSACQVLRSEVEAHFNRHRMVQRPYPNSLHTLGEAFDLTSSLSDSQLDELATGGCQIFRSAPISDRVHFIHR